MRPSLLGAVLLLAGLATSACGSTLAGQQEAGGRAPAAISSQPPSAAVPAPHSPDVTASAFQATTEPTVRAPAATPATVATVAAPVTAMMARLDLTGEPYAAEGDPKAPLTVVEFSDFG